VYRFKHDYFSTTFDNLVTFMESFEGSDRQYIREVQLLVLSPHPTTRPHPVFERAHRRLQRMQGMHPPQFYRSQIFFVEVETPAAEDRVYEGRWRPVQPRDVQMVTDTIVLLQHLLAQCGRGSDIVMLMEDDMQICPGFGRHLSAALRLADLHHPYWLYGRIAVGLNGALFRCREVPRLISHLQEGLRDGPADALIAALCIFSGRLWTYRFNLMQHLGETRSSGEAYPMRHPKCFDLISHAGLHHPERFDIDNCACSLISPCPRADTRVDCLLWSLSDDTKQELEFSNTSSSGAQVPHFGLAEIGQPCQDYCAARSRPCDAQLLRKLNQDCAGMRELANCSACLSTDPSQFDAGPWFSPHSNECRYIPGTHSASCASREAGLRMFCACPGSHFRELAVETDRVVHKKVPLSGQTYVIFI
jgi:hypothetical protein